METRQHKIDLIRSWLSTSMSADDLERVYRIVANFTGPDLTLFPYTDYKGVRVPVGFLVWYKRYPKKSGGLSKCADIWLQKGLESRTMEMVEAVDCQKADRSRKQQQGEFVPQWQDAVRWLKNERWNDSVSVLPAKAEDREVPALAFDRLIKVATDPDQYPQMAGMDADHPQVIALVKTLYQEETR